MSLYCLLHQQIPAQEQLVNEAALWKSILPRKMQDDDLHEAMIRVMRVRRSFPMPADICKAWEEILAERPEPVRPLPIIERRVITRERFAWWMLKRHPERFPGRELPEWPADKPVDIIIRERGGVILNPEEVAKDKFPDWYTPPEEEEPSKAGHLRALPPAVEQEMLDYLRKHPQPDAFVSVKNAISKRLEGIEQQVRQRENVVGNKEKK